MFRIFKRFKYSKILVNHFEKPRNVGSFDKLEKNIGSAIVGAPACGDVMKVQFKVWPETNIIKDAKNIGKPIIIATENLNSLM